MIPRIIHQIWLDSTREPPPAFKQSAKSWKHWHPAWEYWLWSAAEVEALLEQARPDLLDLYRSYPHWVMRADAARYLVVHEHGGIYADLDIVCVGGFDALLASEAVLCPTSPAGVSNDLFLAEPRHPVLRAALDALPRAHRAWGRPWIPPHFRIMCGTGSLLLTHAYRSVAAEHPVRMLSEAEYGHGPLEGALVQHIEGNSWAGWDTHLFLFLARHWRAIVAAACVVLMAIIGAVALS